MSLNLSTVFSEADTILNGLLSKYVGLKFIGMDSDNENKPYYLTDIITTGFYYKRKRLPVTKQVVETLKIVPENSDIDAAVRDATLLELIDEEDNFVRFSFQTETEPAPPNYEWVLMIKPNKQEQSIIT